MNILHLTLSLARGGRRTAIFSLVQGLRQAGAHSYTGCLDQLGCPPEEIAHLDHPPLVLHRRSAWDRAALRKLTAFCREHSIDIIHTHDAASQFTAALARPGIPILMTFHRSLGMESAGLAAKFRNALAGTQTAAVITGSEERRAHFLHENLIPARKVHRIPFGTDLSRFHPDPAARAELRRELGIPPETLLIGAIGHFGPEKGIDLALRTYGALSAAPLPRPTAFVVFGDGPRRPEIEQLALSMGQPPTDIQLPGFRKDIHRCMAALDILLHTPRLEAFGLVLIEAMATGLPVVASRVGGIPDLVRDNATGFLAPPENPDAHAAHLRKLVSDPTLLAAMSAEARRVALSEYSLDLYAQRHLDLYRGLR